MGPMGFDIMILSQWLPDCVNFEHGMVFKTIHASKDVKTISGFQKLSQNFPLSPSALFQLAVQALETPGDWVLQKVDEHKGHASATTPAKLPLNPGHVVQVIVTPAKGRHTRELSTLTITSRPRFGLGGGMDVGGASAHNASFVMEQVIAFFNSLPDGSST